VAAIELEPAVRILLNGRVEVHCIALNALLRDADLVVAAAHDDSLAEFAA
jgi:hypothetical protein